MIGEEHRLPASFPVVAKPPNVPKLILPVGDDAGAANPDAADDRPVLVESRGMPASKSAPAPPRLEAGLGYRLDDVCRSPSISAGINCRSGSSARVSSRAP